MNIIEKVMEHNRKTREADSLRGRWRIALRDAVAKNGNRVMVGKVGSGMSSFLPNIPCNREPYVFDVGPTWRKFVKFYQGPGIVERGSDFNPFENTSEEHTKMLISNISVKIKFKG